PSCGIDLMMARAELQSGTRCSLFRFFIRAAGTIHMRASKSNSDHLAFSVSAVLLAVRMVNFMALAAVPGIVRHRFTNAGTFSYGIASWCLTGAILALATSI